MNGSVIFAQTQSSPSLTDSVLQPNKVHFKISGVRFKVLPVLLKLTFRVGDSVYEHV